MSEKFYMDSYENYIRPPCAQQSQNNVQQYTSFSMSQMNNFNNTYNMQYEYNYSSHITRNQMFSSTYSNCSADQLDSTNWIPDPRAVADIERGLRLSDKIETIEITSKDLSPVSCCSNIDSLIPDFYKNLNKPNDVQAQWLCNVNNMQKLEYPSCSQQISDSGTNFMALDERTKYSHNYSFNEPDEYGYGNDLCNLDMNVEPFYTQSFLDVGNLNQQQDGSNDESDIIVEESDEEATDCSEATEKRYGHSTHCIICNALYTPVGSQFFILNAETPLTMSSQQPVLNKLVQFVGILYYKRNYLCSHCLNLINTIDNLQLKLEASKLELCTKYQKTCNEHNLGAKSSETSKSENDKKRKKFKHFCGLHSFKCKLCKKIFSFKKLYESHMSRHKRCNRYLCEQCGCRFSKYHSFKLHLKLHAKIKPKTVTAHDCKTCQKLFRTKAKLKEHENYCTGNLPYACTYNECDKKFASSTRLKNHVKLKHDKKFVAICSICNIGFVKLSDYKSHKNTHSTEKKYRCTKCEKSYKTVSNLNHHMKFHDDKLPFICTICNKGFMRKEYLESHVNNHNGIKNFACQFCDKRFVSQKNLDAHFKYHEGSVKKRVCDVCNKVIVSGYDEHLRTHNNLKEFECNLCLMKFNTKGSLAKHRKRKHVSEG